MAKKYIDKFVITFSKTYESMEDVQKAIDRFGTITPGTRVFRVIEAYTLEEIPSVKYKPVLQQTYETGRPAVKKKVRSRR
jgi:hypothetical protein